MVSLPTCFDLNDTEVSDVGLKAIGEFTKLTELHLSGAKITNAGLKELARQQDLSMLTCGGHR
jgi:internalin A